jgi:hypothetical protein
MNILVPLVSAGIALLAASAKVGWGTVREFVAMIKEMQQRGFPVDQDQTAILYRKWKKDPKTIISPEDSEELCTIKRAHIRAFEKQIGPWKKAVKIAPIVAGAVGFVLYYLTTYFKS